MVSSISPRVSTCSTDWPRAREGGEPPVLHRAAWLVPGSTPPIQDGAVLVEGNRILSAGIYSRVQAVAPAGSTRIDHGSAAIVPGLVNAHTHLELSGLKGHIPLPQNGFAPWLETMLSLRPEMDVKRLQRGLSAGLEQLAESGCCLCGDITNGVCVQGNDSSFPRQVFLEVLGFDRQSLDQVLPPDMGRILGGPGVAIPPTLAAHACYSTSGALIRETKEWTRIRGLPFSIHVAEHLDEIEFLLNGTGFCRRVLEDLGRWTPRWVPPGTTPLHYLEQLGVLDSGTLLVHAVHLMEEDWQIVKRSCCSVCFCPRSNRDLNIGRPDIEKALECGVAAALGTDSLASNRDLSLFAEAAYILDHYSQVPAEAVFTMATLGGARALGQEGRFGSIEPGKTANLLAVSVPDSLPLNKLFETIIHYGNRGAWRWAHYPADGCAWEKSVT